MNQLEREVAQALRAVGYPLVQTEATLPGVGHGRGPRVDVLAWGPDHRGELRPSVVVEVKGAHLSAASALPQLAMFRDVLGTRRHYVVAGGQWLEADAGLRELQPVEGPEPLDADSPGVLGDVALAEELFVRQLWEIANIRRNEGHRVFPLDIFNELARGTLNGQLRTSAGDFVTVAPDVLWRAARRALDLFAKRDRGEASPHLSDFAVSEAVAALVGNRLDGRVSDPFCGAGGFLWATADRALREQRSVQLHGSDVQPDVVDLARTLSNLVTVPSDLQVADAFAAPVDADFEVVVSSPPMGLKLSTPYELLSGAMTRDGDVAAVDRALRALRPGGRAVLHLPTSFAVRGTGAAYRRYLADHVRVAAVIGLPPGAFSAAPMLSTVLVVLDRTGPGETFVAQLGNDWREQLTGTGAALEACLAHLDRVEADS